MDEAKFTYAPAPRSDPSRPQVRLPEGVTAQHRALISMSTPDACDKGNIVEAVKYWPLAFGFDAGSPTAITFSPDGYTRLCKRDWFNPFDVTQVKISESGFGDAKLMGLSVQVDSSIPKDIAYVIT